MSLLQKGLSRNFSEKTLEEKRKLFKSDANPMKNITYKQKVIDARKGNNSWVTENMKEKLRKRIQESVKNNTQSGNKAILQYDLNGNFIKEWISFKEIKNNLGFCDRVLIDVCKGRKISACGFVWRYKTDDYPLKIEVPKKSISQLLIQYDKEMNTINEFESVMDAYKKTGISRTAIANNLSGLSKSAGGIKLELLKRGYFLNKFIKKCEKRYKHYIESKIFYQQAQAVKEVIQIIENK